MPRITPLTGRNATLLARLLFWVARRKLGQEPQPWNIVAHNPRFLLPFLAVGQFTTGKTNLASEVRILATHLVATLNGCAWCIDFGAYAGQRQGISADKLTAVLNYADDPRFSPAERAALAFAEAATQLGARVSDEIFADLRRHFSEREVVELTVAVAAENFYNRFNVPLGIEAQGFCAVPWGQVGMENGRQAA